MIEFACEHCGKLYRLDDKFAGKKAKCKECGKSVVIPHPVVKQEEDDYELEAVEVAPVAAAPSAPSRTPTQEATVPVSSSPTTAKRPLSAEHELNEVIKGSGINFEFEISQRPDFAMVTIQLPQGEKIYSEPSAMASMTPSVELKAGFKGGITKTIGRAFGGESLIVSTYTATEGDGEVCFAPGAAGDTAHYRLNGNSLMLQRGAFMLHSEGVELTGKWQGAKGFFSGEGLVLLKASGTGDIFFNSYGAILAVDVSDEYIVDTGYVVAFEETLDYKVTVLPGLRAGSKMKSLFFGGEGLVCQFSGQGRVWIQTRHVQSFLSWVYPFRPVQNNN